MDTYRENTRDLTVDLKDLFYRILAGWKGAVIIVMILALLFAGLLHFRAARAHQAGMAAQQEETVIDDSVDPVEAATDKILSGMIYSDRIKVEAALLQKDQIDRLEGYVHQSPWVDYTGREVDTLFLQYYIRMEAEEGADDANSSKSLIAIYGSYVNSDEMIEKIKALPAYAEYENFQVRELIGTDLTNGQLTDPKGNGVLNLYLTLPGEVDGDQLEKIYTEALTAYAKTLSKTVENHEIILVRAEKTRNLDSSNLQSRNSYLNSEANTKYGLANALQGFNSDQNNAYDKIVRLRNGELDPQEILAAPQVVRAPTLGKKQIVLALAAGILLYLCAFLALMLLRGRIRGKAVAEDLLEARALGEVYMESKKGFPKNLFASKVVSRVYYGGKLDAEAQTERAVRAAGAMAEHKGVKELAILSLAEGSEKIRELEENLVNGLAGAGVNAKVFRVSPKEGLDERLLLESGSVIPLVEGGVSSVETIREARNLFREYETLVLGMIYAECV